MHTVNGIAIDTWIDIDGSCSMQGEVVGPQAQIELGHGAGSLHLVLNERGLSNLVDVLSAALTNMRRTAQPPAAEPA